MSRLIWFLLGYWEVGITGASPQWCLNVLAERRIPFWDLEWIDPLEIRLRVFRKDLQAVLQTAEACQCEIELRLERSGRTLLAHVLRRPALLILILLTLGSLWIVPKFLLFFEVEGNETISDAQILRELDTLEIGFGTLGVKVKPQWIEDHMLNAIPQLQWITVNRNGCKATVVARERPATPQVLNRKGYANVYASHGGLVTEMSVLSGQAVKSVGDFVVEGDLLVSGLVDADRIFLMEYAQAEVYARTWRKTTMKMPENCIEKGNRQEESICIWLEIGNQRIKIFGNSGISTSGCDKMISRKILTLPDGSVLPVGLLVERLVLRTGNSVSVDRQLAEAMLKEQVEKRLLGAMQAGEILSHAAVLQQAQDCYVLHSVVECHEMIAQTVEAKWSKEEVTDD